MDDSHSAFQLTSMAKKKERKLCDKMCTFHVVVEWIKVFKDVPNQWNL